MTYVKHWLQQHDTVMLPIGERSSTNHAMVEKFGASWADECKFNIQHSKLLGHEKHRLHYVMKYSKSPGNPSSVCGRLFNSTISPGETWNSSNLPPPSAFLSPWRRWWWDWWRRWWWRLWWWWLKSKGKRVGACYSFIRLFYSPHIQARQFFFLVTFQIVIWNFSNQNQKGVFSIDRPYWMPRGVQWSHGANQGGGDVRDHWDQGGVKLSRMANKTRGFFIS